MTAQRPATADPPHPHGPAAGADRAGVAGLGPGAAAGARPGPAAGRHASARAAPGRRRAGHRQDGGHHPAHRLAHRDQARPATADPALTFTDKAADGDAGACRPARAIRAGGLVRSSPSMRSVTGCSASSGMSWACRMRRASSAAPTRSSCSASTCSSWGWSDTCHWVTRPASWVRWRTCSGAPRTPASHPAELADYAAELAAGAQAALERRTGRGDAGRGPGLVDEAPASGSSRRPTRRYQGLMARAGAAGLR